MPGITGSEDGSSALSGDGTADGIETVEWQPGTITELALGENIEFSEPTDVGGNYENFMYRNLLAIAAALGVPYVHMTGDVEKANYSNTRAAVIEYRRRITMLQSRVVIHQFCRPVWRRWVEQAVLAGTFRGDAADIADRVKWILPRWDWVDPLKDQQAEALAVEKGFKARADVIEATGEDPAEVDQRRAQDREREQAAGLAPAADSGAGAVDPSEPEERAQVAPRRARGA